MFKNKQEAALALLEVLNEEELKQNNFVLVCLSLSSILLCDIIAKKLELDYELFFSADIYAPNNSECEIACVSETEEVVLNEALINSFDISLDFVYGQAKRVYEEKILKQVYKYRKGNLLTFLKDKNVLLIDDGCENGSKIAVSAKSMREIGVNNLYLACAVISDDLEHYAMSIFDGVYCARKTPSFVTISFYFEEQDFLSEADILKVLEESPHYLPLQKPKETTKEQNKE